MKVQNSRGNCRNAEYVKIKKWKSFTYELTAIGVSKNLKASVPNPTENNSIPPKRNAVNNIDRKPIQIIRLLKICL